MCAPDACFLIDDGRWIPERHVEYKCAVDPERSRCQSAPKDCVRDYRAYRQYLGGSVRDQHYAYPTISA